MRKRKGRLKRMFKFHRRRISRNMKGLTSIPVRFRGRRY